MQWTSTRGFVSRLGSALSWSFTWGLAMVFICLLVGAAAVILPPLASIGMVAAVGLVLLWAMPELHMVPDGLLRRFFFLTVLVAYTVPVYYAVDIAGLPWISVRRIFLATTVALFALTIAGSQTARSHISESLRAAPALATCAIGFFVMMVLSVFTSAFWPQSLASLVDATLAWYVLFAACVLLIRTRDDVHTLLKILVVCVIIVGSLGLAEFFGQQPYYLRVLPAGMVQSLIESNPALANIGGAGLRRGLYRSVSMFNTPLAFGEFAAMMGPLCAYFVVHPHRRFDRILGVFGLIFCMISIFCSGARGAYMGFLLAVPLFALLWALRQNRLNPRSLAGGMLLTIGTMFSMALVAMVMFWPRMHDMVLGGAETTASDQARFIQWNMAWPRILDNPVTGNGFGLAGHVVGYVTPSGMPTVDSYVISLLVDLGVPGFLFFVGMMAVAAFIGVRMYLTDPDQDAEIGGAIACALLAFGVYRTGLSQVENHTLFFLLIGICFAVVRMYNERRNSIPAERSHKPTFAQNR